MTILGLLAAGFVAGRFLWERYYLERKDTTLESVVGQTKKELFVKGKELDDQLGKVLGESESNDLSQVIKEELEKSKLFSDLNKEVTRISKQTTKNLKDLPQKQLKTIKKEIRKEIYRQLLELLKEEEDEN